MKTAHVALVLLVTASAHAQAVANTYPLVGSPVDSLSGDLNRDARDDLVTLSDSGIVGVSLGTGRGQFKSVIATSLFAASSTQHAQLLAQADFNHDGRLDLVVAIDSPAPDDNCAAAILLGHGNGGFAPPVTLAILPDPSLPLSFSTCSSLLTADFNHDGHIDFALAYTFIAQNHASPPLQGELNIFLGHGDGSFATPRFELLGNTYGSRAMAAADFDGDSRIDLVFAEDLVYLSGPQSHQIEVLLGDGTGGFPRRTVQDVSATISSLARFRSIVSGDFNRDGDRDIAFTVDSDDFGALPNTASGAFTLLGKGDGTFASPVVFATTYGAKDLVVGDFDRDCLLDLAIVNAFAGYAPQVFTPAGTLAVYLGRGNGAFAAPQQLAVGGDPSSLTSGHFSNGAALDLCFTDAAANTLEVLSNTGCEPPFSLTRLRPGVCLPKLLRARCL